MMGIWGVMMRLLWGHGVVVVVSVLILRDPDFLLFPTQFHVVNSFVNRNCDIPNILW